MKTMQKKGFTLIELLVVISIIGLLSTIVVASLTTVRKKARDTKRVADIKSLQLALELYFDTNRSYPLTLASLAPTYVPALPKDPVSGNDYSYAALTVSSSCSGYHIGATLEDTANISLNSDSDAASTDAICVGSGANFSGVDPVFDIKN